MGTSSAVVVTPVYWSPSGFTYPSTYPSLTEQFITDIAHDDGLLTNVFSNVEQYTDASNHPIMYDLIAGTTIVDTDPFPSSGACIPDTGAVYTDNSGYTACITDSQLQTELSTVLTAHGLPSDLNHLYLIYLPKGVESCFTFANNAGGGTCTISAQGGSFCGYHSSSGSMLYADLPYSIVDSPTGKTCGSDGGVLLGGGGIGAQSPNGNFEADTAISVTSHEISEAITDPFGNAWFDSSGNEIADDCAYIYGDTTTFGGSFGSEYNQTINGHHYFIQEEFSNHNFSLNPVDGCSQGMAWTTHTVTFEANGGSGTVLPESDNAPTALNANDFVRTGYSFADWNTAQDGSGTNFANGAIYAFNSDVTLYAQWQAISSTTPTVTWAEPSPVGYGTALSGAQLDATASVPGSFSYSPSAGVVLGAGTTTLSVTFNPTDSVDYNSVTKTASFTVNPASLQITASSTTMAFGDVPPAVVAEFSGFVNGESAASLSSQPACATSASKSTPAGSYSQANSCSGAVDPNYAIAYTAGSVTITPTIPIVSWPVPAAASYGTALSGAQLDATASIPGSFSYSPSAGAVLSAGTATLAVTFNPTDAADFSSVTKTVSFTVNPTPLQITASSTTMAFGSVARPVVATFNGFVRGESATSLSTQPACVTAATKSTPSGIDVGANSCSGASDPNYAIAYSTGSVSITQPVLRSDVKTLAISQGAKTTAKLTCASGVCKGTLSIIQRQVTHVKKGKKRVTITKSIVLGHVSFFIKPGKSATETIALNQAGKLILSKASSAHPASVSLKLAVNQGRTTLIKVKVI